MSFLHGFVVLLGEVVCVASLPAECTANSGDLSKIVDMSFKSQGGTLIRV